MTMKFVSHKTRKERSRRIRQLEDRCIGYREAFKAILDFNGIDHPRDFLILKKIASEARRVNEYQY